MKKVLYIITVILLIAVFSVSAYHVGSYFLEGMESEKKYEDLSNLVHNAQKETTEATDPTETTAPAETTAPTEETTEPTEETEPQMIAGYKDLYEMNNDVVGWIKIDGTQLDYPVMQTSVDNRDFYLYKDFYKEKSDRGSIYIREECDMLEPSDNITIYGHNMRDGSMFAALNSYEDKETWEENSLIFFDNLYEFHVYKIFAVFKTSASLGEGFRYHQMIDAASEEDFNEFISTCKKLSFYDTGITPKYGDKTICLSTCEYTLENGRLVVAAVRIS